MAFTGFDQFNIPEDTLDMMVEATQNALDVDLLQNLPEMTAGYTRPQTVTNMPSRWSQWTPVNKGLAIGGISILGVIIIGSIIKASK